MGYECIRECPELPFTLSSLLEVLHGLCHWGLWVLTPHFWLVAADTSFGQLAYRSRL